MELPPNPGDWTYGTVLAAVQAHDFEPGYLDFKAVLTPTKGARDAFNTALRRTVCSMANADGGYILFGVTDRQEGTSTPADRVTGIPLSGDLRKEFGEKIKEIQPAPYFEASLKAIPLPGDDRRGVLVVHIPQSLLRPHMVHPPGIFYRRGSGGHAVEMDYYQVRDLMVMRRQKLLAILKWEAEGNIATLCAKRKGLPFPHAWYMAETRAEITLTPADLDHPIRLTRQQASRTASFLVVLPEAARIRTAALQEALLSGEFLAVSRGTGALAGDQTQVAQQALLDAVNDYRQAAGTFWNRRHHVLGRLSAELQSGQAHSEVYGSDLAALFRLHDLLVDLLRLSVAILRHALDPTGPLRLPPLGPLTPLEETARQLAEELPTREEVEQWVTDGYLWTLMTSEQHVATMEDVKVALEKYPTLAEPLTNQLTPYLREFARRAEAEGPEAAIAWLQQALRESSSSEDPIR